ncbi:Phosphoserine aminotransferase [Trebouxia sp. C0009 RCD-2024]
MQMALSNLPRAHVPVACTPRRTSCFRSARAVAATAQEVAPAQQLSKPAPHGRLYNFAAGPAVLPVEVLEEAQQGLLNWKGSGTSVMEMSHRGKEFSSIIQQAEDDLRSLLSIPDNYQVLFLQGGASTAFANVPLNLTKAGDSVDHIVTGSWSKKGAQEAQKYCKVNVAAKGDNKHVPAQKDWKLQKQAKYVHYCDNETIQGVEFKSVPDVGETLLVADMSSNFCSKPVDVSKYGLIYAGAQKNIGPSGVTVYIIRNDLVGHAREETPATLDFKVMEGSMYNTPPCWAIYMCGLVFNHMLKNGGIEAMQKTNQAKAKVLYDAIDGSDGFYVNPIDKANRSNMNVPFTIPSSQELEAVFVKEAAAAGMVQLKGHRSVGGMRASIYNSMPVEGVQHLVDFMKEFQESHKQAHWTQPM